MNTSPIPPVSPKSWNQILREKVFRLHAELDAARLLSANRLAAIRAALGAAEDGETDPLGYLRDQLAEEESAGTGGRR
jgi:hypothetical protein